MVISRGTPCARLESKATGLALCVALIWGAAPQDVSAAFIIGDLTMSGDVAPTGGAGIDFSDATGLDFLGDDFNVDAANGDFAAAGVSAGDVGAIHDFQFDPLLPAPVDPLWTIAGFSYMLESVSITFQNSFFLVLEGTGAISAAGFDETPGSWRFSANKGGTLFNFSSGFSAVPEPSTSLLLAMGLAGLAYCRRLSGVA